jgi:tetratricopeptide (TPR) repeat protein
MLIAVRDRRSGLGARGLRAAYSLGRRAARSYAVRRRRPALATALLELERETAHQDLEKVRSLGERLLSQCAGRPQTQAVVHRQLGEAWVRLCEARRALDHLRRAAVEFDRQSDIEMLVDCLELQAAALQLLEEEGALALAEEALELCRALDPVPAEAEAKVLSRLGAIHVSRHDWRRALKCCQAALATSGVVQDLSMLARLHADLGEAHLGLKDFRAAAQHSRKALSLLAAVRDRACFAAAKTSLGLALLSLGEPEQAESHLLEALASVEDSPLQTGRGRVLLALAELYLRGRDERRARSFMEEAGLLAESSGDVGIRAAAHQLKARLWLLRRRCAECDHEFREAFHLLWEARSRERLIECHVAYAEVLEERGELTSALEQWKDATLLATGQPGARLAGKRA